MIKYLIKVLLITIFIEIVLLIILKDINLAAIITLVVVVIGLYGYNYYLIRRFVFYLYKECDPVKSLKVIEKLRKIASKSLRTKFILDVNKSVGLGYLGKYAEAKDILIEIGNMYKPRKKYYKFIFNINLLNCLYELGDIEEAEDLFDHISRTYPIKNKKARYIYEIIEAERLYFLERFEECKEKLLQIQNKKLENIHILGVLYRLAQINEIMGNNEQAIEKYREVAENGNLLWIAEQAKNKVYFQS